MSPKRRYPKTTSDASAHSTARSSGFPIHHRDHSPILLAYPNARILPLGQNGYLAVNYEDTEHYQLTRRGLNELMKC